MFFRHLRALAAPAAVAAALALASCSSDSDTPVGSEFVGGVLGSQPGEVFQDTIAVIGDTVLTYFPVLASTRNLEVGLSEGYVRVALLRPDFSDTDGDENRTVTSAALRMRLQDLSTGEDIVVRFYTLGSPYSEGDSVETLDTLDVITDPETGSAERVIDFVDALQPLPPELVQGWIRGDSANNGIAVVYQGTSDRLATFDSSERPASTDDPPVLQVEFSDQTSSAYDVTDDATFVRPTSTTPHLIISDGYVRRVYFRLDLDELNDSSAVHRARIRFNFIPGTIAGINQAELYIPDSDDVGLPAFRTGRLVTNAIFGEESEQIEFVITNTLLGVISGDLKDTGFVMRFVDENTGVRFAEFYGSSAPDTLAPTVILTSSTPAEFDRD